MATSQSNNSTSSLSTKENPTLLPEVKIIAPSKKSNPDSVDNIASLINPSTISTLKSINNPAAFGEQAIQISKQKIIKAVNESVLGKLLKIKADLIQEGIQLEITHQITLAKIELDHTPRKQVQNGQTVDIPPILNDEEYQLAVDTENKNYNEAKKNLQDRKDKNQKDLDDYYKDPFKKQKEAKKARKEKRAKRKARTKEEKRKARIEKAKSILKNAKKTLVPIITLFLTNKIAEIIAQNEKIKKLVDDTNAIITAANESGDPTKLNNAKLARDNAIKIIQSNEDKIIKIKNDINKISTYISIFSAVVSIISAIPIPTSVPPGIGIPVNLIIKLIKILDKANRILLSLSALIPILLGILNKVIDILENYKSQLLNINKQLEQAASSGEALPPLLSTPPEEGGIQLGTVPTEYRGFKFAIREDNSFGGISVGGFKRHYAVAIDIYGVEVLKSEYSFTLDPNDLIEQLKLVIDQQGLFTGPGGNQNLRSTGTSNDAVQDFSTDIVNANSLNSLISETQKQQKLQQQLEEKKRFEVLDKRVKRLIDTQRPPLTAEQKAYYNAVKIDPLAPPYERLNAQRVLERNYV